MSDIRKKGSLDRDLSKLREVSKSRSFDLGPQISQRHAGLLQWCLINEVNRYGWAMEFGVGYGASYVEIAKYMDIIGFDSFEGLPEDWRPNFERGSFAASRKGLTIDQMVNEIVYEAKDFQNRCEMVIGLFSETIPERKWIGQVGRGRSKMVPDPHDVTLIHIDCDLYSSTKTVLENIADCITTGTVIVFDEWHGYSTGNPEEHEQKAFKEFAEQHPEMTWRVIGHGPQQWAIYILDGTDGAKAKNLK